MKWLMILISCLMFSCGYEDLKDVGTNNPIDSQPPQEGGTRAPPEDGEPAKVNYAAINAQIIQQHCLRCHGDSRPRAGVVLTTYENLTANLGRVQDAINSDTMPPSGPLSADLKQLYNEWVQSGAPRD
jgi:hypothetical protein